LLIVRPGEPGVCSRPGERKFSFLHSVETGSGAHLVSLSLYNRGFIPRG